MSGTLPIFYGTTTLRAVRLLLRFAAAALYLYLSRAIGPAGVGMLHLILAVHTLAYTAGLAGMRISPRALSTGAPGRRPPRGRRQLLTACAVNTLMAVAAGCLLYNAAPRIAEDWIGSAEAAGALRIFGVFLPVCCLGGVLGGYFTAAGRLAALDTAAVSGQLCALGVTLLVLLTVPGGDPAGACQAAALGSGCGSLMTLGCLLLLQLRRGRGQTDRTTLPPDRADQLGAGLGAWAQLTAARRMARFPGGTAPLAAFGILAGMMFPVMTVPASIPLFLAEPLIPELSRCGAGSRECIRYLIRRNLRLTLLYGLGCAGVLFLWSDDLCRILFPGTDAAAQLRLSALLVPLLCCSLIADAMVRGLGRQKGFAAGALLCGGLELVMLYILVPRYGMAGFWFSFALGRALHFGLRLRSLLRIGGLRFNPYFAGFAVAAGLLALWSGSRFAGSLRQISAFGGMFFCLLYFFGILTDADLLRLRGLLRLPKSAAPAE